VTLKHWLIALPLVFVAALCQSYFFVPAYEWQSNPARLSKHIDASIGDAEVLNPLPNANTVSRPYHGTSAVGVGNTRCGAENLGLDVFDPVTMELDQRQGDDVPAWFLDTNYNGLLIRIKALFHQE